jgi:hypothetical protein
MALSFNGVKRANERNRNKDSTYVNKAVTPDGGYPTISQPTPVDLDLTLEIVSVFEEDLHQIINNFVAYFNPYVSISWKEPFTGQELITKVYWSGSASYDTKIPLPSDESDIYRATTQFTAESYIWKVESDPSPPIICFDMDWYSLSATQLFVTPPPQSATDSIYFCATPCVYGLTPTCVSAGGRVSIHGTNLDNVDAVFLMGESLSGQSAYDLYKHNSVLSADYDSFVGRRIDSYTITDENHIDVQIPSDLTQGFIDIRLASLQGGYTDLTQAEHQAGCFYTWSVSGLYVNSSG